MRKIVSLAIILCTCVIFSANGGKLKKLGTILDKAGDELKNAVPQEQHIIKTNDAAPAPTSHNSIEAQHFAPAQLEFDEALKQFFSLLNAENIMIPSIIDPEGRIGQNAQLHIEAIPGNDDEAKITMGILIEFDTTYYTNTLLPKIIPLLGAIGDQKDVPFLWPSKPKNAEYTSSLFDEKWQKSWVEIQDPNNNNARNCLPFIVHNQLKKHHSSDIMNCGIVAINVAKKFNYMQNPFQLYQIKNPEKFRSALNNYAAKAKKLSVCFSLLNKENEEIDSISFPLNEPNESRYDYQDGRYCFFFDGNIPVTSGWLIIHPDRIRIREMKQFEVISFDFNVKKEDIKHVSTMKVSFKYIETK